jgi:hypothetical protein
VSTKEVIRQNADGPTDRRSFQRIGDRLDRRTRYRWVVEAVAPQAAQGGLIVVDAARRVEQIEALRVAYPSA